MDASARKDWKSITAFLARRMAWLSSWTLRASTATALTGIAGIVSDVADQVNNFAPFWLAAAIVSSIIVMTTAPSRRRAAMAVLSIGVGSALVAPDLIARALAVPAEGPGLRLLAFNAWLHNDRPLLDGRWILSRDADVIVISEVPQTSPLRAMLARTHPHVATCSPTGRTVCSTLIYSRLPMLAHGGLGWGDPDNRLGLSATWMRIAAPGGPVTIVGLHLDHPAPLGAGRNETKPLGALLATLGRSRTIVAGDLNRTPWSHALARLESTVRLDRATFALPSWPAASVVPAVFPIDHVYLGSDLAAGRIEAGPPQGSDHLPIIADVVTGPRPGASARR